MDSCANVYIILNSSRAINWNLTEEYRRAESMPFAGSLSRFTGYWIANCEASLIFYFRIDVSGVDIGLRSLRYTCANYVSEASNPRTARPGSQRSGYRRGFTTRLFCGGTRLVIRFGPSIMRSNTEGAESLEFNWDGFWENIMLRMARASLVPLSSFRFRSTGSANGSVCSIRPMQSHVVCLKS